MIVRRLSATLLLALCFIGVLRVAAHQAGPAPVIDLDQAPQRVSGQRRDPGPRVGHSIIYDELRRRVLLVDGYLSARARPMPGSQPDLTEVWAWSSDRWELVTESENRPRARTGNSAIFDVSRGVVVSYGGTLIGQNPSRDDNTWEWDGQVWRVAAAGGACSRDHQMVTYDRERAQAVMFGGACRIRQTTGPTDTWVWRGNEWKQVASDGPAARISTMAYDDSRKLIVLFGGIGDAPGPGQPQPLFNDTWVWNGTAWRQIDVAGPRARTAQAMSFDGKSKTLLMYGGIGPAGEPFGDFWEWNGTAWAELRPSGPNPGPRQNHAMVYDAARQRTVLYGGSVCDQSGACRYLSDTWEWDGRRWEQR